MTKDNKNTKQMLTVTLTRSINGCTKKQIACVRGLGLRRINHTTMLEDTLAVRGMINKISHMVSVK